MYDLLLTYETTYMYYIHVQTEMYCPKCPNHTYMYKTLYLSQFLKEQTR